MDTEIIDRDGVKIKAIRGRMASALVPGGIELVRAAVELARPGYLPGIDPHGITVTDYRSALVEEHDGLPAIVTIFADDQEDKWVTTLVQAEHDYQAGIRPTLPGVPTVWMTPAEFRAARETIGYSIDDVLRGLDVSRSIVQKWEAGTRPVPQGVADQIEQWQDDYQEAIDASIAAAPTTLTVWSGGSAYPERDTKQDDPSWASTGRPARWHRQIAAATRAAHGTRIIYQQ